MSRQCAGTNKKGEPCGAHALKGGELCSVHAMTPEERARFARKGGQVRQKERREVADATKQSLPEVLFAPAVREIARLLDATVAGRWGQREPDVLARSWGCLCVSLIFSWGPAQRQELVELLERIRPGLIVSEHEKRLLDVEAARAELVRLAEAGAIAYDELPPGVLARA